MIDFIVRKIGKRLGRSGVEMTAQPLSKKSRDELNISLNILYRKFVKKSDPGSKERNSPATDDISDSDEEEEQENQLSAAVGIGI